MGASLQLYREMQKASLYAMTSANECFPLVLLEAQNAGIPVVSYDCPHGPRNIINDGKDGLLVRNQNKEEFSNELSFLIANQSVRLEMSKNAIENSFKYAAAPIMECWNDLMRSIV